MIAIMAAAAVATVSASGGSASVRVSLSELNAANARPVLLQAATNACRAVGEAGGANSPCVQDALRWAMSDYRKQARRQTTLVVADRR